MLVEISSEGILELTPENSTESFALRRWLHESRYKVGYDTGESKPVFAINNNRININGADK